MYSARFLRSLIVPIPPSFSIPLIAYMVDYNNPIVYDEDFGEYAASTKHVISRRQLNPSSFFEQW